MAIAKFDRYMVKVGAGRHAKFARFTDGERVAYFLGVLSIAAQSPIRGYLLVGDHAADHTEIAQEAAVSKRTAQSTIDKLKKVGVLEHDDELGAWRVHDWSDVNPEPKKDATATERQRRHRDRLRAARNGGVTA